MKTILFLVPLVGAVLMATAAEPAKTDTPTNAAAPTVATEPAVVAAHPAALSVADQESLKRVGERIALSGALTKTPPSRARKVGQLFNPFAPVEPQSQSRWLERAAWSTAATAAAGDSKPVEMRHEPRFGISIAGR